MKTYVVGAQGNHFNEMFLAHKTGVKIEGMREYYSFDAKEKKMKKNHTCFGCSGGPTRLAYMLWMDDKMLPICLIEN